MVTNRWCWDDVFEVEGTKNSFTDDALHALRPSNADLHVEAETGPGYGRLLQLYGVHKATIEARRKGLSVVRRPQQNGGIKLVIMGV